ncbi:unnamed protein product [Owenia fusiformis]|uniref:Uncharacterized protein n=1 Tax=Owenia fusiformis TaxID=6347 RepID=A0A8S4Q4I9_OWEFU|nr:unnamed protein product [Owenia fusiformis]
MSGKHLDPLENKNTSLLQTNPTGVQRRITKDCRWSKYQTFILCVICCLFANAVISGGDAAIVDRNGRKQPVRASNVVEVKYSGEEPVLVKIDGKNHQQPKAEIHSPGGGKSNHGRLLHVKKNDHTSSRNTISTKPFLCRVFPYVLPNLCNYRI